MSGQNGQGDTVIRLEFTEHGKIRFISHRDVGRIFERAFRKLKLPVAYSEGFSPRPKFSFGLALSVGHESEAEYLDVTLSTPVDLEDLPERLTPALPDGLAVTRVGNLEPGTRSLQEAVTSCEWHIEVVGVKESDVAKAVESVLSSSVLLMDRERKGKRSTADVRPAILQVEAKGPTDNGMLLYAELGTDTVSLRPDEFVGLFGPDASLGRVLRIQQWTNTEGSRRKPLDAPVGHATVCAS